LYARTVRGERERDATADGDREVAIVSEDGCAPAREA